MEQLIVDIGNTSIKTIVFKNNKFQNIHRFKSDNDFEKYIEEYNLSSLNTIISSVRSKKSTVKITSIFENVTLLNHKTKLPIRNDYTTPETLGNDRLANVVYANSLFPDQNNLVIDIGTCTKFDFINDKNQYKGGSISLGFSMRYKALHNLTENLPLYDNQVTKQLTGNDTKTSIFSGVYLGMVAEIKQFITEYETIYEQVNVFLTGGDLSYFENEELSQKNSIFVDPLITLKGLKVILDYNEQKI